MELLEGTVIAMHGPLVRVQAGARTLVVSSRRRLNWQGGTPSAAQLVVGDRVSMEMRNDDGVIVAVHARRSSLQRRSPRSSQPQLLAANVDQALLVFSAHRPDPNPRLLDRFLVACHLAGIEAVIVVNKIDQGLQLVERWLPVYQRLGYPVYKVSTRTAWGLGQVKRCLPDRTTLFCGPSGAGKSSLLNRVYPGFELKVGSISEATGKGTHTTTTAELMPLPFGGFVVDTPGLKEFGLWQATSSQLRGAFRELAALEGRCRFPDCSHDHEPDCAVPEALESGAVSRGRYDSYLKLLAELAEA